MADWGTPEKGVPYGFGKDGLVEVTNPSMYPPGKCYVIQFFENVTVHHEGDERSRTNPGHGYPAYTEHVLNVRTFITLIEGKWRESIARLFQNGVRSDVAVFVMERANIQHKVEVQVTK